MPGGAFGGGTLGDYKARLADNQARARAEATGPQFVPETIGKSIGGYQDFAREAVEAYGRQLQPHLMREIGNALGGLNSIGALRSGGTEVALRDISRTYTDDIGNYAAGATRDAIGFGQAGAFGTYDRQRSAFEGNRDWAQRERMMRDQKKAGLMGGIGGLLGAGVGFIAGGPAGAGIGARIGGGI